MQDRYAGALVLMAGMEEGKERVGRTELWLDAALVLERVRKRRVSHTGELLMRREYEYSLGISWKSEVEAARSLYESALRDCSALHVSITRLRSRVQAYREDLSQQREELMTVLGVSGVDSA